jgi:hypothetical protein
LLYFSRRSASTDGRSGGGGKSTDDLPDLVPQSDPFKQEEELEMLGVSTVMDPDDCLGLSENLPARLTGSPWKLEFTTETDGFSLNNIYRKLVHMEKNTMLLIAIRDTEDCCFGAFVSHNLIVGDRDIFYGTGESFLWRTKPDFKGLY